MLINNNLLLFKSSSLREDDSFFLKTEDTASNDDDDYYDNFETIMVNESGKKKNDEKIKLVETIRQLNKSENVVNKLDKKQLTPIVCPICGILHRRLDAHMQNQHPVEGPYQCDFCGKLYKCKRYLRYHFNIHMDIR